MGVISALTTNPLIYTSITALISVGVGEYVRRRHQQKTEARKWYGKSKGYLSNIQQATKKATAYRDGVNYDILYDLLNGLDEEMMMHANNDPKRVDNEVRFELAVIAAYTTGLASLSEKSSESDALDFVKRVQGDAIENYEGDYDMDDLEDLFSRFDFEEFAKTDRDVDINEREAERLRSQFSDESLEAGYPESIEEALNIPIEEAEDAFETEGYLNTVVDDSMELFVNMVHDLAKEAHARMDARQQRI